MLDDLLADWVRAMRGHQLGSRECDLHHPLARTWLLLRQPAHGRTGIGRNVRTIFYSQRVGSQLEGIDKYSKLSLVVV